MILSSARTILVVGASDLRRRRSVDVLVEAGHCVDSVATVAEATVHMGSCLPALVIFDFGPDESDAVVACREIKKASPEIFILQLSPPLEPGASAIKADACIDAYLIEPVDPQELLVLIRSLLRLRKVEGELRDSEERLLLAQKSAGLAILDWVIPTNTFIHSDNFSDLFDLPPRDAEAPLSPTMLLERIHPDDLHALLGEFSEESLAARDFSKEFRIVCRDGSVRWIGSRGRLFSGPSGAPERMLSLNYDITDRKAAERANAELASIVGSSVDAIIGVDLTGCVTSWNPGATRLFGRQASEMIGSPLADALPGVSEEERGAFRRRLRDDGSPGEASQEYELSQRRADGSPVDMWVTSAPLHAPNGNRFGTSLIVRDISQKNQREDHVRFLMRELTHRSKNLLAVIQAMARQSLSRDITPGEFVERFTDRLAGLAGSHDLLSRVDWRGVPLMDLIRSQLNHYIDLFGTRILLDGADIVVKPEAAQNIGIALHELSTNAAKYGALSNDEGRVSIAWHFDAAAEPTFRLTWREEDGPAVAAPSRKGFGHVVMDRIAGRALGGRSGVEFAPQGVVWTLEVPKAGVVGV